MRVLIIGYEGFIGSHLYNYFKEDEHIEVYKCGANGKEKVKDGSWNVDRINPDYSSIFKSVNFDVCINASGAASVPISIEKPYEDFCLNTLNVIKLLEAIRLYSPNCKFINLSSAAVYGNPDRLPINENGNTSPLSPYGFHKLQSEAICKEFYQFYGIRTLSFRIFSAYGPRLKKQIFWDLAQKYLKSGGEEIILFGTGDESRDFIYVEDIVKITFLALSCAKFTGEVVNVGNGEEIFMKDAISLFYKDLGRDTIHYKFSGNTRLGDPNNWKADISIIKNWGYQREYSFEEGIIKYITWLKEEGLA